jgi:homocysteine S-methyltransferase
LIVDGGLGLELERRGFVYSTRLWSGEAVLVRPDLVVDIHRAYLAAGARVIETATYQLAHGLLRELGFEESAIEGIFVRAVGLAREAIAAHREESVADLAYIVAGSMGPYGATVGDGSEYTGTLHLGREELFAFHAERTRAVARAAPDVLLFETIPTGTEALVIAHVVRELELQNVWLSLSCADAEHTYGGDRVDRIVRELETFEGIAVVGVNCTAPENVAPLVRTFRSVTTKPIAVCPNLGQHWESGRNGLAGGAPEAAFIGQVADWLDLGVTHIGGCCGVGPETIEKVAALVARAT